MGSNWTIDKAHSEIQFRVRHMMISWVSGYFEDFDGQVAIGESNPSEIEVSFQIRVDSISTGNSNRDEHLRSIDFFDAGRFPEIQFSGKGLRKDSDDKFHIQGELNLYGTVKTLDMLVEFSGIGKDPWGNERAGFSAFCEINRNDFGISWNTRLETGGILIGELVQIHAEIQLVRKS